MTYIDDKPKHYTEEMRVLMQAFGFTEADLELNRAGELGESQLRSFQSNYQVNMWWLGCATVIAMPIALAVYLIRVFGERMTLPQLITAFAIPGLIICALVYGIRIWRERHLNEIETREVAAIEGRIQLGIRPFFETYEVRLRDKAFELDSTQFLAFKNGEPYILYYNPVSHKLLSVEVVS